MSIIHDIRDTLQISVASMGLLNQARFIVSNQVWCGFISNGGIWDWEISQEKPILAYTYMNIMILCITEVGCVQHTNKNI